MIEAVSELPLHDVARFPLTSSTRCDCVRQRLAEALEINALVRHAPMVDVRIEFGVLRIVWIKVAMAFFIVVSQFLQIVADGAQRANDHVGAGATSARHIAVEKRNRVIILVVNVAALFSGGGPDFQSARCRRISHRMESGTHRACRF